jgi:hypothetical protein
VPAGFVKQTTLRAEGKRDEVSTTSLFVLRSPQQAVATQSAETCTSNEVGEVLSMSSAAQEGGVVTRKLAVTRKGPRRYAVTGTLRGQKLDGTFATKAPLLSDARRREVVKGKLLAARGPDALVLPLWSVDVDPLRGAEQTFRRTSNTRELEIELGAQRVRVKLDADGHAVSTAARRGNVDVTTTRVYHVVQTRAE